MEEGYKNIFHFMNTQHGIDLSVFDTSFLLNAIQKRMVEINCKSVAGYEALIAQNSGEPQNLIDAVLIGHTFFFRNPLTFSVLEQIILPEIIFNNRNKHKEIRIWSAACAGGQEVYSMAIVLEGLNHGKEEIGYRLLGTDQHEKQISRARMGEYSIESVGNINHKQMERWLTQNGNTFSVIPELKKKVEFSVFDLFDEQYSTPPESIFGEFDIVFCANLLFYYKPKYQKIIIDKIKGSLAQNGYLITGETERDILKGYNFKEVYPHSAIYKMERG